MTPVTALDVDLTDRALYRGGFPHELFTDLRARGAVLRHPEVRLDRSRRPVRFWAVVRHAEVQEVSRDWQRFSSLDGPVLTPATDLQRGESLVHSDPPTHTRMRKLISAGFTPKMIGRLDDLVVQRTEEVLGAVDARDGEVDFVRDVAYRLPMHIIADIVGIPEADRDHVFGLTDTFMRAGDPQTGISDDDAMAAQVEMYQYAAALGTEKRARPADDVWSILATAEVAAADGTPVQLSQFQLDMFFLVLSVAGSETTRNAISQGLLALVERPDDLAALRADPSLWDTATDEVVRWASPVADFTRTATCDTEVGGQAIATGDRVTMFFPSANRDEREFDDPFRFDVRRTPNHHVSFGGGGVHYCLGAHLARREIRTMLTAVLARYQRIEVTGDVTWTAAGPDQAVAVSVDTMPVRLARA